MTKQLHAEEDVSKVCAIDAYTMIKLHIPIRYVLRYDDHCMLCRSCRLAFMTQILFIFLLLDKMQALREGKGDAVWDTSVEQIRVSPFSVHSCSDLV